MLRILGTLVFGCLVSQSAAHAATITITGECRNRISVTIEKATVDLVLGDLREKYGFEVSGIENAQQSDTISETMSGSVDRILQRLLRNWNYMIVRSDDSQCGIAKIMLLNSGYGTPTSPGASSSAGAVAAPPAGETKSPAGGAASPPQPSDNKSPASGGNQQRDDSDVPGLN
jgi:hypothetical protein